MPDDPSTYWTLIRDAAGGSRRAREEFARRYEGVVRASFRARWRGTPLFGEIDDAVQEVFVDCFKTDGALGRADSTRPGGFRAYLYGVVRNTALVFERKQARRRAKPSPDAFDPDGVPADDDGLATIYDRAWATAMLRQAGLRQAEKARSSGEEAVRRVELLNLRFREGMPVREIARLWGEDVRRIHRQYARAREEFLAALVEVVAWHQPGSRREAELEASRLLDCFA